MVSQPPPPGWRTTPRSPGLRPSCRRIHGERPGSHSAPGVTTARLSTRLCGRTGPPPKPTPAGSAVGRNPGLDPAWGGSQRQRVDLQDLDGAWPGPTASSVRMRTLGDHRWTCETRREPGLEPAVWGGTSGRSLPAPPPPSFDRQSPHPPPPRCLGIRAEPGLEPGDSSQRRTYLPRLWLRSRPWVSAPQAPA